MQMLLPISSYLVMMAAILSTYNWFNPDIASPVKEHSPGNNCS
jgi:hypothetical protein